MRKRFLRPLLSVAVAVTMAVVAVGCGSSDNKESSKPAGSAAPGGKCDSSNELKFGVVYSLTGPTADIGALAKDGAEMAIREVNASGGVLGRCVDLILKDDEGDPTKGAQVTRELVDQENVDILIGPFLSSPASAALEITTPAKKIELVQSALTSAADPEQFPYSFTNENNSQQIAEATVAFMKRQGYQKPGIIAVNNAYGTQTIDLFKAAIAGSDIKIAGKPQLFESGAPNLNAQVGAVVNAGADVIMIFNVGGPDQTATIKARNQLAPRLPMIGTSALVNASTTDNFTADEMKGVYSGPYFTNLAYKAGTTTPVGAKVADWISRYKKFKGIDKIDVSISQTVGAYDGVMIMKAAIEGAGKVDADAIKDWFEGNSFEGVRATNEWSKDSHAGVPADQNSFVVAKSLVDGIVELAPNEG